MKRVALIIIICICQIFYQNALAEEILSKEDARKSFSLSFNQWSDNLKQISIAGVGKVLGTSYELTLVTKSSTGFLKTTPIYTSDNLNRPSKLVVSVEQSGFNGLITKKLTDQQLIDMISQWYNEMLPEYTVMTKIQFSDKNVQTQFFIFEVGTYPPIDIAAKKTQGCWQKCILRN